MPKNKFYELSIEERLAQVKQQANLTEEEAAALSGAAGLSLEQADHMIENVVGRYSLPLGIAQNFVVNGRDVLVPMVVEEPSVVAGASFMARLAGAGGGFVTSSDAPEMIGQMQILDVGDPALARMKLLEHKQKLLHAASSIDPVLEGLGGGPRGLEVRIIPESPIASRTS